MAEMEEVFMMENLSMHVLDIMANSIRADASEIHVTIIDSRKSDLISIEVIDNGKGMDQQMVIEVQNPFFTTRSTRKIGLGIPFFKELGEQCEGAFELESEVNKGTRIYASMKKSHWDTPPMGDIGDAIMIGISAKESVHTHFEYIKDNGKFCFDTTEIREILGDEVSICEAEIMLWCKDYINQGISLCETQREDL